MFGYAGETSLFFGSSISTCPRAFPRGSALEVLFDIGKFVGHLVTIGMVLASLGLLREATLAICEEIIHPQMVSLGQFSREVQSGGRHHMRHQSR